MMAHTISGGTGSVRGHWQAVVLQQEPSKGLQLQARLLHGTLHLEKALLGLILFFCHLQVLNLFFNKGSPFPFCSEPCKLCSWSWV